MRMRHLPLLRTPALPWQLLVKPVGMVIMGSVRRFIRVTYSRVGCDALSTHVRFVCRIYTTSNVVIPRTEMEACLKHLFGRRTLRNMDHARTCERIDDRGLDCILAPIVIPC